MHMRLTRSKWPSMLRSELIVTPKPPHGSDSVGPLYNSGGGHATANPLPEDDQFPGLCGIKTQVVAFRPFDDMLELLTSRSKTSRSHQQEGVIRELRHHILENIDQ